MAELLSFVELARLLVSPRLIFSRLCLVNLLPCLRAHAHVQHPLVVLDPETQTPELRFRVGLTPCSAIEKERIEALLSALS